MHTSIARIFLAFMLLGQALPASAAEGTLPQTSARPAAGAASITETWKEHGGARLYWNTLVLPRQMRMGGARFSDPAAVPELAFTPPPAAAKPARRHSPHKVQPKKPPQAATGPAPRGVGSTALKMPAAAPGPASRPIPPAEPPVAPLSAVPPTLPADVKAAVAATPPANGAAAEKSAPPSAAAVAPPYAAEKPPSVGSVRDDAGAAPPLPGAVPKP